VNRNVTTPEGAAVGGADTPAECHIRHAAALQIEGTRPRDTQVLPHEASTLAAGQRRSPVEGALARRPLMAT